MKSVIPQLKFLLNFITFGEQKLNESKPQYLVIFLYFLIIFSKVFMAYPPPIIVYRNKNFCKSPCLSANDNNYVY